MIYADLATILLVDKNEAKMIRCEIPVKVGHFDEGYIYSDVNDLFTKNEINRNHLPIWCQVSDFRFQLDDQGCGNV